MHTVPHCSTFDCLEPPLSCDLPPCRSLSSMSLVLLSAVGAYNACAECKTHTHERTNTHTHARTHAHTHTHTSARERARARTRTHTHIHTHTGGRAGQLPPGRRPLPLQRPPPPRLPLDRPMGLTRTRGAGGVTVVKSSSKTSKCSCLQEPWLCTHLQITRENQLYTSSPSEVHEEPRLRSAF